MPGIRDLDGQAADYFAQAWSDVARHIADITTLDEMDKPRESALRALAEKLSATTLMDKPYLDQPHWVTESVRNALAANSRSSTERTGEQQSSGKKNAFVGREVRPLFEKLHVREYVEEMARQKLDDRPSLHYAMYDTPGAHVQLHADTRNYGDISMIICLDRHDIQDGNKSATTFITAEGAEKYILAPGQVLVFDGTSSIHGRTPVDAGESISLLIAGYKLA